MTCRIILVGAPGLTLRATAGLLWPDSSVVRAHHHTGWSAIAFSYSHRFEGDLALVRQRAEQAGVDVVEVTGPLAGRPPGLVVSDVDSTITRTEGIDLLAEQAGRAREVAEVTDRAMAGELDFTESLRARVACLSGLPVAAVAEASEAVVLTDGAPEFVDQAHRAGAEVALVSGGFTAMVEPLAEHLGVDHVAANTLEVEDGHLTGRLTGPVVDRAAKAEWLRRWAARLDLPTDLTVAVGDGANDIDMLTAAGLGVSLCGRPAARAAADAAISRPHVDAVSAVWTV